MSRDAQIAARVLEMRFALSRIELAASQLLRQGQTPVDRALIETIRLAVEDLDARIDRSLLLLAGPQDPLRVEDCAAVPAEVVGRLAPVVGARGIRCRAGETPRTPVPGDPERLRRGAVALLRGAARWAGEGGQLELSIGCGEAGTALKMWVACGDKVAGSVLPLESSHGSAAARTAFADAYDLALAEGADLQLVADRDQALHATFLFGEVGR